jgi:hypothetical protein
VALVGGFQTKQLSVDSRAFDHDGKSRQFVHIAKKTEWLVKMCGGSLKRAGAIIDDLRAGAIASTLPAVAGGGAEMDVVVDVADPMDAMDDVCHTPQAKKAKTEKKGPTPKKTMRDQVLQVSVSKRSPSAWSKHCNEKIMVSVVVTNPHGVGKLWLLDDDLPWLVAYLADEVGTGSVKVQPADAGQYLAGNCVTPWLSIKVKPQLGDMGHYLAVFVGGPLKGKEVTCKVSTFTQTKWDACMVTGHRWQCPGPSMAAATPAELARAAAHFLELACARMLLEKMGAVDVALVSDPIASAVLLVEGQDAGSPSPSSPVGKMLAHAL